MPARGPDHVARARGKAAVAFATTASGWVKSMPTGQPAGNASPFDHHRLVAALAQDGLHLAAHLAVADHRHLHRAVLEELVVQQAHRALGVALRDHEGEVHVGGAERDHHDVDVAQGLEDRAARPAWRHEAAADHADDRHAAQHLDLAERGRGRPGPRAGAPGRPR